MLRFGFFLIALALGSGSVLGATLEQLSLDQMVLQSTAIVRAKARETRSARTGPLIYTFVSIDVIEQWKGPRVEKLEISLPGGEVGGFREHFGGVPLLSPGLEFVAFLWTGPSGRTQILGLSQGFFEVIRDRDDRVLVHRKPTSDVMLSPDTMTRVPYTDIQMPVEELAAKVAAVLAAEGTGPK